MMSLLLTHHILQYRNLALYTQGKTTTTPASEYLLSTMYITPLHDSHATLPLHATLPPIPNFAFDR